VPNLRGDSRFKLAKIVEIGYQGITINVGKSDIAQKNPLGKDPRVREAFELSLDRDAIVKVAMEGEAQAGNQWVAPSNRFYGKSAPLPKRNVARAKQLLQEAGVPNPSFTLMTPTTSDAQRIAQVVQSMAKEAGFDIKLVATEFASALTRQQKGDYVAFLIGWSGRSDPDGNINVFILCGAPLNEGKYCDPETDKALNEARTTSDHAKRVAAFERAADRYMAAVQRIYLYHVKWFNTHTTKLAGFNPHPDGLIRLQGLKLQ
jgi:peptide/nickel transport system substrate-binding protein